MALNEQVKNIYIYMGRDVGVGGVDERGLNTLSRNMDASGEPLHPGRPMH